MTVRILTGDARAVLATLPGASSQTCVTSPPYYGLRDYGVAGQLGLEPTPEAYVAALVETFRAVWRVLREDGTLWLNLGDSYANDGKWGGATGGKHATALHGPSGIGRGKKATGAKPKDLLGIPWRVALALQADGWYLRQEIIWHKPNPMPEAVKDRPTRSHEQVFLLSKAARYFYDADAITEEVSDNTHARVSQDVAAQIGSARAAVGSRAGRPMKAVVRGAVNPKAAVNAPGVKQNESFSAAVALPVARRNKRTVWTVGTQPFSDAHFATFPPKLIEPCVLAGSRPGDTVLDPFGGAGTTGLVADRLGRDAVLVELNPAYAALARERLTRDAGMFADVQEAG